MTKLKLGPLTDDKPVKLTIELPGAVYRDIVAYAEALGRTTDHVVSDPAKLVAPMIARFMSRDRGFTKSRKEKIDRRGGDNVMDVLGASVFASNH